MSEQLEPEKVRTTVIVSPTNYMSREDWMAWGKNLLKFTAPTFGVFFGLLATGVDWRKASLVALYGFYQALSDFFGKYKGESVRLAEGSDAIKKD